MSSKDGERGSFGLDERGPGSRGQHAESPLWCPGGVYTSRQSTTGRFGMVSNHLSFAKWEEVVEEGWEKTDMLTVQPTRVSSRRSV